MTHQVLGCVSIAGGARDLEVVVFVERSRCPLGREYCLQRVKSRRLTCDHFVEAVTFGSEVTVVCDADDER